MLLATFLLLFFLDSSMSVAAESCGGILKDPSGEITSPNYPNNYPDDVTCTWKISPEKTHVNLTIEDFRLEDSQTCKKFDFVKIKVQQGRYSTQEVTVCGSQRSREISLKVDGTAVEITFKSDLNVNERGFNISYQGYDIDPCLKNNGDCSHNCSFGKGKRTCTCPVGYKLTYDLRTCRDENSCVFVGRQKCPYRTKSSCHDIPNKGATCVCWGGYKKQNGTCQDIDECKETPDQCGVGVCRNYVGYFSCSCPKGYRNHWQSRGQACKDIDECSSIAPPNCGEAVCVNTPGSYICQCEPGYKYNDTLKTCEDDDECAAASGGCDHVCSNTDGSFACSCHLGYFLDSDGKTCRAVKVESLGRVLKTKACQGEFLTMSCRKDPRNTIIIFQASYGRNSEVCPYKPGKPLPFKQIFEGEGSKDPLGLQCEEDVTKLIDKRCGWKKACDVAVTSSVSDRCGPGANQYLSVAYSCGRPLQCRPIPPSDSCAAAVKDECESDDECLNTQMCCFDGCKRVCSEPVLYTNDALDSENP